MKILFIDNSPLINNGNDFCVELKTGLFTLELKELGNEIIFYGQKLEPTNNTIHIFGINKNGMQFAGLWRKKNKILNYLLLYIWVIKYVYQSEFIYIFYPTAFKYIAFIAFILNRKYGIYIRGMEDLNDKASIWIYKHAHAIFTVSDNFTDFVNNKVGNNIANTIKPMNYFDENDIVYDRLYACRKKYRLLYLGRTSDDKGIIELLKAISILKVTRKDFELSIVGTGEYILQLKDLANHLHLTDLVIFKGGIYDKLQVKNCYLNSDIFILPTYHEGFPRTLYEAMIFGTPIITTFVGGISTHMKHNFNCIEITPKSVDSIVQALTYSMDNYNEVVKLAKNGFTTVAKIVDSKRFTHAQDLNQKINNINE